MNSINFKELKLLDLNRGGISSQKYFEFEFSYKGKNYTLVHHLYYGGISDHEFKLKKPWFTKNPFKFSKEQYLALSDHFMTHWYKNRKLS